MNKFFASFIAVSSATMLTVVTVMGYGQTNQKPAFFGYLAGFENSVKAQAVRFGILNSKASREPVSAGAEPVVQIKAEISPAQVSKTTTTPDLGRLMASDLFRDAMVHIEPVLIKNPAGVHPGVLVKIRSLRPAAPRASEWLRVLPVTPLGGSVSYVAADGGISVTLAAPNDTFYADQWGLTAFNIESAWDLSLGQGITVAVIDTGVQYTHEDISNNIWINADEVAGNGIDDDGNGYIDDVRGWDFRNSDNDPADTGGHGSHVAGIIAAERNNGKGVSGVAPSVKIMPLRVTFGSEFLSDMPIAIDAVINAIRYATDNGAKVISISLGFDSTWFSSSAQITRMQDAVTYAKNHGSIVVVAAGNDNAAISDYPALFGDVFTIGALHKSGSIYSRASYSNYGSQLDFAAPGSDIVSLRYSGAGSDYPSSYDSNSNYMSISGTSMATPMVSGAVALILAQDPLQTFDDIYRRLRYSATDMGTSGRDDYYGYGLVNPFKALSEDYYNSGAIKTRFYVTPNQYGVVRMSYDTAGKITGGVDPYGNTAAFEFFTGTSTVWRVTFYSGATPTGRVLEFDQAGWLKKENFVNGDIRWYFGSGNWYRFSEIVSGKTYEYLNENFFGNNTGRYTRIIRADKTYTTYEGYYAGKNVALYQKEYDSGDNLLVTRMYDQIGQTVPADSVLEYYPSGVLKRYANVSTGVVIEYRDEDYYLNRRGRISKLTDSNGAYSLYDIYWTGTDQAKTVRFFFSAGDLIKTVEYYSNGQVFRETFVSGEFYSFYVSGNRSGYLNTSPYINREYFDEDFYGGHLGRVSIEIASDGSYVRYDEYWTGTDHAKKARFYSTMGGLIKTVEYDATGQIVKLTNPDNTYILYDEYWPGTSQAKKARFFTSGGILVKTLEYDLVGQITKLTNPDGTYYFYDDYWPGTVQAKVARYFSSTGALIKTIEYDLTGKISKEKSLDGSYILFDEYWTGTSQAKRARFFSSTGALVKGVEYDSTGRLTRETTADGAYATYIYWTSTSIVQKKEEYNSSGIFTKRTEYYSDGNLQRIFDAAANMTTEYYMGSGLVDFTNPGRTATFYGNAKVDTSQYKVTGPSQGSISFDGSGDKVTFADSDDWSFGNGNFTIDFWVKFNSLTYDHDLVSQNADSINRWYVYKRSSGGLVMGWMAGGVVKGSFSTSSSGWSVNTWYHLAFVRDGATPRVFINGVSQPVTTSVSFGDVGNVSAPLTLGYWADYLNGYMDEFRVSKGVARWTSNFTPQTIPYVADDYTKLLTRETSGGMSKKILASGEIYEYYVSGNRRSYFNPNVYTNRIYIDENFYGDNVGRLYKEIAQDGSYGQINSYWTSTDRVKEALYISSTGSLLKTVEYYEDGSNVSKETFPNGNVFQYFISGNRKSYLDPATNTLFEYDDADVGGHVGHLIKKTLSTGEYYEYFISGNLKKHYTPSPFLNREYFDEDFYGGQLGRVAKETASDGAYTIFDEYWTGTDHVKIARFFSSAAALIKTVEYDATGQMTKLTNPDGTYSLYDEYWPGTAQAKIVRYFSTAGALIKTVEYDADGKITKETNPDSSYMLVDEYWTGTSQLKIARLFSGAGVLIKTVEYRSTGQVLKETFATGEIYQYFISGNRQSYFNPTPYTNREYLDEDFYGGHLGRLSKETGSDGIYVLFDEYWAGTAQAKKARFFTGVGTLVKSVFYYSNGSISRENLSNGDSYSYYISGNRAFYYGSLAGFSYAYIDENFNSHVGRIARIFYPDGSDVECLNYWPNTAQVEEARFNLTEVGLVKTVHYSLSGAVLSESYTTPSASFDVTSYIVLTQLTWQEYSRGSQIVRDYVSGTKSIRGTSVPLLRTTDGEHKDYYTSDDYGFRMWGFEDFTESPFVFAAPLKWMPRIVTVGDIYTDSTYFINQINGLTYRVSSSTEILNPQDITIAGNFLVKDAFHFKVTLTLSIDGYPGTYPSTREFWCMRGFGPVKSYDYESGQTELLQKGITYYSGSWRRVEMLETPVAIGNWSDNNIYQYVTYNNDVLVGDDYGRIYKAQRADGSFDVISSYWDLTNIVQRVNFYDVNGLWTEQREFYNSATALIRKKVLLNGAVYQYYFSGNRQSYYNPATMILLEYYDNDLGGDVGQILRQTLSTGEITEYFLSGNRMSHYDPATQILSEYFDEDLGGHVGRLSKKTSQDGSYETYEYWDGSAAVKLKKLFSVAGALLAAYDYDAAGFLVKLTKSDNSYETYIYWPATAIIRKKEEYSPSGILIRVTDCYSDGGVQKISDIAAGETTEYFTDHDIVDLGRQSHIPVFAGDARVDTSVYATDGYSNASTHFDGTGDFLSFADSEDWNFGSGDFTVDCSVRFSAFPDTQIIAGQWLGTGSYSWTLYYSGAKKLSFAYSANGTAVAVPIAVSWTASPNTFYHIAVTRKNNVLRLFVNGTQVGSDADLTGISFFNSPDKLKVGASGTDGSEIKFLNGFIDEFRISKGLARWSSNFTPSSQAYASDAATTLLLRESAGVVSKKTLATAEMLECYLSGNRKSHYDPASRTLSEYLDEDLGGQIGRLLKKTFEDGSYETYGYWTGTAVLEYRKLYSAADVLLKTYTHDSTGLLTRVDNQDGSYETYEYWAGTADKKVIRNYTAAGVLNKTTEYYSDGITISKEIFASGEVVEHYSSGNVRSKTFSAADASGNIYYHYIDENWNDTGLGRVDRQDCADGAYSTFDYWTGTAIKKIVTNFTASDVMISKTEYYADGVKIYKETLEDGRIIEYYQTGNRKSFYDPTTGTVTEYFDEDMGGRIGRIYIVHYPDGTWTQHWYWGSTATLQKTEEFASSGVLTKRTEYYPDGGIQRVFTASAGETIEYFTDHEILDQGNLVHPTQLNGNAQSSAGSFKVTGAAGYPPRSVSFDGNGDYLTIPDGDDWSFGAGDFTIDFWANLDSVTNAQGFFNHAAGGADNGFYMYLNNARSIIFRYSVDGIAQKQGAFALSNALQAEAWYHFALVRSPTGLKLYINGTQAGTTYAIGTDRIYDSTQPLEIGTYLSNHSLPFKGFIDEFRVSKGIARYTENFTPQTTPYDVDSYTKLLLRESTGGISKKTLSTGEIYDYYLSGNRKSYYDPATKKKLEYYDENLSNNIGRAYKETAEDGSYVLYDTHWTGTIRAKSARFFSNTGILLKTAEYLNEDLSRIDSVTYPNGLKEVYTYFGNTTSVQTRAYYSGAALLGTETFLESGPLRSRQYPDGTVRWYHPSGNLLKVVSVKPAGKSNFYQYHPSINLRRVTLTPDGTTWEYLDEDFYGDKQGRLSKILSFDGSYDLYQDYWTGTDQVKTIKRFNPSGILQATYTYNQNGSLQSSVGSGTPPDFGYRSTATYYASGRIKSRTLQDGSYVEYRDESFNGDNTGRMTLLRETSGLEYRYLEYRGDNASRGWFDPTGQVTLVERYQPGASNPLTKLRLQYRESDGRLWHISSVPQDEPAAMPSQTTGSNPINPELASRLDMTSELQEQNKTLSRSVPVGNRNTYADLAGKGTE